MPKAVPEKDKIRVRNVCFTSFSEEKPCWCPEKMRYLVYQKEKATTGNLHWQGYMELRQQMSYSSIKKMLGDNTVHLEPRRGTAGQASAYCKKTESRVSPPEEYGEISCQGERKDLLELSQMIDNGSSLQDVAIESPEKYIRYHRGIKEYKLLTNPSQNRPKPEIYYISGPPGSGKSRWAHEKFPDAYIATDSVNGWFDGYDGQSVVIFDEFDGLFPLRLMLRLLDYYRLDLPVKGGFVPIKANVFVFTSNKGPKEVYGGDEAWLRRVKEFARFASGCGVWREAVLPPST